MSNACGLSLTQLKNPKLQPVSEQIIEYIIKNNNEFGDSFIKDSEGKFSRELVVSLLNEFKSVCSLNERLINNEGEALVDSIMEYLNSNPELDVELIGNKLWTDDDTPASVHETYQKYGSITIANDGLRWLKWRIFSNIVDVRNGVYNLSSKALNESLNDIKIILAKKIFNENIISISNEQYAEISKLYNDIDNSLLTPDQRWAVVNLHNFDTIISDILKISVIDIKKDNDSVYNSFYSFKTHTNLSSGISYESDDQYLREANDFTKFVISSIPFTHYIPGTDGVKPVGTKRYMSYPIFSRTLSKIKSFCNSTSSSNIKLSEIIRLSKSEETLSKLQHVYNYDNNITLSELYSKAYFNPVEYMNDLFIFLNEGLNNGVINPSNNNLDSTTIGSIIALHQWLFDGPYIRFINNGIEEIVKETPIKDLKSSNDSDSGFSVIDDIYKVFQSTDNLSYYGCDISGYSTMIRKYNTSVTNIKSMFESNVLARLNSIKSMRELLKNYNIDYNIELEEENSTHDLKTAKLTFSISNTEMMTIELSRDSNRPEISINENAKPFVSNLFKTNISSFIYDILGIPEESVSALYEQGDKLQGYLDINDEFIYNCKIAGKDHITFNDLAGLLSNALLAYELSTNEFASNDDNVNRIIETTRDITNNLVKHLKFDPVNSSSIMRIKPFVNNSQNSVSMVLESIAEAVNATLLGDMTYVNTMEGKRYFEQITHRLMTSAKDVYNVEHKNSNSPARDASIFKHDILNAVGQFVEVRSGDNITSITKMNDNDILHTFVVKGIIEQLNNETRSKGNIYVNPTVLSDKPIVLTLEINLDKLKGYLNTLSDISISNNEIDKIQKTIDRKIKDGSTSLDLFSDEGVELLTKAIKIENLTYLTRQIDAIKKDIDELSMYSSFKNESDLMNVAKQYNLDPFGFNRLTELYITGQKDAFNKFLKSRYSVNLDYNNILQKYGTISSYIEDHRNELLSVGFRNKIDIISDYHLSDNLTKLVDIYKNPKSFKQMMKSLELISIDNLLKSGFNLDSSSLGGFINKIDKNSKLEASSSLEPWMDPKYSHLTKSFGKDVKIAIASFTGKKSGNNKQTNDTTRFTTNGDYRQRTSDNAAASNITLAIAVNFNTRGEQLTKTVAGDKYIGLSYNPNRVKEDAKSIYNLIKSKGLPTNNIKLNIAGNGIYSFDSSTTSQDDINNYVTEVIQELMSLGITISEIRSGGQTGVDEAGIIAAKKLGIKSIVHTTSDFAFRVSADIYNSKYKNRNVEAKRNNDGTYDIKDETLFKERFKGVTKISSVNTNSSSDNEIQDIPIFDQYDMKYFVLDKKPRGEYFISEKGIPMTRYGEKESVLNGRWVYYNNPDWNINEWKEYQKKFNGITVVGEFKLHPFLKTSNLITHYISESYINTTCGNIIHFKGKPKNVECKLIDGDNEYIMSMLSMLDSKNVTAMKRMTNLSAQKTRPVSGSYNGIPTRHGKPTINIALFDDSSIDVTVANSPELKNIVTDNGATRECFLYTLWKKYGLASDGVNNSVSKDFYSLVNTTHGVTGIIKTANFALDNETIRNSYAYYNLNKHMMNKKWKDQVDEIKAELLQYKIRFEANDQTIWNEISDDYLLNAILSKAKQDNSSDCINDIIDHIDSDFDDIMKNELPELMENSDTSKRIGDKLYQIGSVSYNDETGMYDIIWSEKKGARNNYSITESVKIDSAFTLWEALGGTNSYTNGKLSDQSFIDTANILNGLDLFEGVSIEIEETRKVKNEDVETIEMYGSTIIASSNDDTVMTQKEMPLSYQFGKHAIISLCTTKEAAKTFQTNVNNISIKDFGNTNEDIINGINDRIKSLGLSIDLNYDNFIDKIGTISLDEFKSKSKDIQSIFDEINKSKLNITTKDVISAGRQNDATHTVNDSTVAVPSQIIYLSTGNGSLYDKANKLFNALQNMIERKIGDIFEENKKMCIGDENKVKQLLSKKIIEIWANSSDGSESNIINNMIAQLNNDVEITGSFDGMNEFNKMVTTLGSFLSKSSAKLRLDDSTMSVLMPSDGLIMIHDGKLRSRYGNTIKEQTEQLQKLQLAIEQQLMNSYIETNGVSNRITDDVLIREREGKSILREFSKLHFDCPYIVYRLNSDFNDKDESSNKYNRIDEITINTYNDYVKYKQMYNNSSDYVFVENIVKGHNLLPDSIIFKDNNDVVYNMYDLDVVRCIMSYRDGNFDDTLFNNLLNKYGTLCFDGVVNAKDLIGKFSNNDQLGIKSKLYVLQDLFKRQLKNIQDGKEVSINGQSVIPNPDTYEFRKCQAIGPKKENYAYEKINGIKRIIEPVIFSKDVCDATFITETGKCVAYINNSRFTINEQLYKNTGILYENKAENIKVIRGKEFVLGEAATNIYIVKGKKKYPLFVGYGSVDVLVNSNKLYNVKFRDDTARQENDPNGLCVEIEERRDNVNELLKITDKLTDEFIALRTPSQNKQSGMAMNMVDYLQSENNNVYVSSLQLLFQGSDFDIDKITMLMYARNVVGTFEHWSNINIPSDYILFKESFNLEYPTGKDCVVLADGSGSMEWYDILSNYLLENEMTLSEFVNKCKDFKSLSSNDIKLYKTFVSIVNSMSNNKISIPQEIMDNDNDYDALFDFIDIVDNHNNSKPNELAIQNYLLHQLIDIFTSAESWVESHSEMSLKNLRSASDKIESQNTSLSCPGVIDVNARNLSNAQEGKDCIGIIATANKGIKTIFHASEKAYNGDNKRDIDHASFDVTITHKGKEYKRSSFIGNDVKLYGFDINDFVESLPNKVTEQTKLQMLHFCGQDSNIKDILLFLSTIGKTQRTILAKCLSSYIETNFNVEGNEKMINAVNNDISWGQDENNENISEFVTASTDNAKEMLLSILNSGNDVLPLYAYCLAIDIPLNVAIDILNSPVVRYIAKQCKGSLYKNISKQSLSSILKIAKGNLKFINDEIIRYLVKELNLYVSDCEDALKGILGMKSPIHDDKLNIIAQKLNITSADPGQRILLIREHLYNILEMSDNDMIVNFANKQKIRKDISALLNGDAQILDTLTELSKGASELTTTAQIFLSRNQGMTSGVNDDIAYAAKVNNLFINAIENSGKETSVLSTLKNITKEAYKRNPNITPLPDNLLSKGMIDIRLLENDMQYFNELEDAFENVKHTINPFFVVRNAPHMMEYFKTQCSKVNSACFLSNAYKYLMIECLKSFDEFNQRKDKDRKYSSRNLMKLRNAMRIDDVLYDNDLLREKNGTGAVKRVIIPAKTVIKLSDTESVMTPVAIPVKLGNNFSAMAFKSMFEQFVINNQRKGKFSKALRHFTMLSKKNGPFKTEFRFLSPKIDLHDKDNSEVLEVFNDVYSLSQEIIPGTQEVDPDTNKTYGGLTFSEGLILYNYIVHLNENNRNTFTKLINSTFSDHYLIRAFNKAFEDNADTELDIPDELRMAAVVPVVTSTKINNNYMGNKVVYNRYQGTEPIYVEKENDDDEYEGFEDPGYEDVMSEFFDLADAIGVEIKNKKNSDFRQEGWRISSDKGMLNVFDSMRYGIKSAIIASTDNAMYVEGESNGNKVIVKFIQEKRQIKESKRGTQKQKDIITFVPSKVSINGLSYDIDIKSSGKNKDDFKTTITLNGNHKRVKVINGGIGANHIYNPFTKRSKFNFDYIINLLTETEIENRNQCNIM